MAEDEKLFELFTESCLEQLRGIEAAVLDLETAGASAFRTKVEAVFRAAHTIKGDAGALGLPPCPPCATPWNRSWPRPGTACCPSPRA